ncbi:MAG: acetyltransferase [Helicobacteraceae bacterium]|nr:acetyltransferase [Helicobacteraceae bacterium]
MALLGIYGCGGLGREILELARDINEVNSKWDDAIFIDDSKRSAQINGAKVYTFEELKANHFNAQKELTIVIAIGEPAVRAALKEKVLTAGFALTDALIHPLAKVAKDATIEKGSIVCYGAFISNAVIIKSSALIQPSVCVGHDTIVGENCVISSFTALAGACSIGDNCYIGMNAAVREKTSIGNWSIVGMGSIVHSDIPEGVIALGSPARVVKNNDDRRVFR